MPYDALMQLKAELADALRTICAGQDIVPFLDRWLSTSEAELRKLPDDMLAILSALPDFTSVTPGGPPVTLQLETEDAGGGIMVYRAVADGYYYVAAPSGSS